MFNLARRYAFRLIDSLLPDTYKLARTRGNLAKCIMGVRAGTNFQVERGLDLGNAVERITLGRDVYINKDVHLMLDCSDPSKNVNIQIGDRVQIGAHSVFWTGSHELGNSEARAGNAVHRSIVVGDGAWIGLNCTLMPGVTVGAGSVINTGSVVVMDVAADTMVAGNPARQVKKLGLPTEAVVRLESEAASNSLSARP